MKALWSRALAVAVFFTAGSLAQAQSHSGKPVESPSPGIEQPVVRSDNLVADNSSPTHSANRWKNDFDSEDSARAAASAFCEDLRRPENFRRLVFGLFTYDNDVQDIKTSFPASLVRTGYKLREELIQCKDVHVSLEKWMTAGRYRAIDSRRSVTLIVLGALAGEFKEPAEGKFGAYAQLKSSCVLRPERERALLRRHYECLKFDDDYAAAKKRADRQQDPEQRQKLLGELDTFANTRPLGCDEVAREIAAAKIEMTHFPSFEELKCVQR